MAATFRRTGSPPYVRSVQGQLRRIEHRAFDADALVVPAVRCLHLRDAAEADADAAGHRRFERQVAGHIPACGDLRQRVHHRLGAAGEEVLWWRVLFEQLSDEAAEAEGAVVA